MDELEEVLRTAVPKVKDWRTSQNYLEDGVIDSIDIISMVSEISDHYDVDIPSEEMEAENFCSLQSIYDMLQRIL